MKKYKINEIFYSIQGEGFHAGRAAVFIRFSGCNLNCDFCDTNFESFAEMTLEEIIVKAEKYPFKFIVLTGGEPMLQVDRKLLMELRNREFEIAIETNGTIKIPDSLSWMINWITVSPKEFPTKQDSGSEIKIVFDYFNQYLSEYEKMDFEHFYLQPMDGKDIVKNRKLTAQAVMTNPKWKVSIQMHKILGIE